VASPPETLAPVAAREAVDLRRFSWIRPLVTAHARDYDRVAPLFSGNPSDLTAWQSTIARVSRGAPHRDAVADALAAQLTRRQAPPAAHAGAALLRQPASVAIVTGQQAGLFGGPLYTLLKAVTAIQLARKVTREHGVPAVPVFWVDAEDHDWNEIRTAQILDASFSVVDVSLGPLPGAGSEPVGRLVLDDSVETTIAALQTHLAPSDFTADVIDLLRRRYRAGTGVGAAFAGLLDDLLGAEGLVVFESDDAALKPLVADLFVRELDQPCKTTKLARDAGALMTSLGHAPQVEPADDSVALFHVNQGVRRSIRRQGEAFTTGDSTRSADELKAEAQAHPERFSPNVLLRPIVQDRLFPTACYVAGPSELAYQAQLGGIYREFGVEPPLLYSRASATIVDSAAGRFFERSGMPLEALQAQDESALNKLLESQLPPGLDRAIGESDAAFADRLAALKPLVAAIDPTLGGAVDTTVDKMRDTLKTLQNKIIHAAKRKDETLRRQFTRTRALTFPAGTPQERALSVVFFLNRYGVGLGHRLLEMLPLETDQHYVLTL
jgi:bacillithiol biosynthesis cysteine-adding enzyme BshC